MKRNNIPIKTFLPQMCSRCLYSLSLFTKKGNRRQDLHTDAVCNPSFVCNLLKNDCFYDVCVLYLVCILPRFFGSAGRKCLKVSNILTIVPSLGTPENNSAFNEESRRGFAQAGEAWVLEKLIQSQTIAIMVWYVKTGNRAGK